MHAAINHGRVELTPDTTVIHDEAALASTREQLRLLHAVETSGARLVAVGDPQQNQPVGAGGLWERIEHTTLEADALVELTRNQRARDHGDRHSQTLFRQGEIELAIRTYAARDRVHLDDDQQRVEDQALEAAQRDHEEGKSTLVIAQTSNEHLDELNARAQAIRQQKGELGNGGLYIPGRPYQLHAGDEIQVRHTINHPEHGPLRNGTGATVISVDPERRELELRLRDGSRVQLDQGQVENADLRLAYVQHPFPAQGHTTDTAHVIITGQVTREGTYVAITRAREQTHIYNADVEAASRDADRLERLAERVSQTEPDVPSINTPLAHEVTLATSAEFESDPTTGAEITHQAGVDRSRLSERNVERSGNSAPTIDRGAANADEVPELGDEHSDLALRPAGERGSRSPTTAEHEIADSQQRRWPGREVGEPRGLERDDGLTRKELDGWEM